MDVLKCRNCHWVNGKVHSMCIYCEFPLVKAERDKYKAALLEVKRLLALINGCNLYIHSFEGADHCEECIERQQQIDALLTEIT